MALDFIHPESSCGPPIVPEATEAILAFDRLGDPGLYTTSEGSFAAICLRCTDTPCATFSFQERGEDSTVPAQVCPTNALVPSAGGMEATSACIGCGLCVTRCGFGAIKLESNRATTLRSTLSEPSGFVALDEGASATRRDAVLSTRTWSKPSSTKFAEHAESNLSALGQHPFYPFVASLLTCLGVPTRAGRAGDTALRMDAVSPDPLKSMPIEIKSPSEVAAADLKSIRQALENHVIMRSRATDPTTPKTATIAIGFAPISSRSDVAELARDIETSYGVLVRVFSTSWLLRRLAVQTVAGKGFDANAMRDGTLSE